jgi:simple sugar transport system permease protein
MIAGEFDISVGSIVPASSMTVAMLSGHYDLPATVGILGGLAVGISIGFVNGLLVTRTTIPFLNCDHWRDVCGYGPYSWVCCSA